MGSPWGLVRHRPLGDRSLGDRQGFGAEEESGIAVETSELWLWRWRWRLRARRCEVGMNTVGLEKSYN